MDINNLLRYGTETEIKAHIKTLSGKDTSRYDLTDLISAVAQGRNPEILPWIMELRDKQGNNILHLVNTISGFIKPAWDSKLLFEKNSEGHTPIVTHHKKSRGWNVLVLATANPLAAVQIKGAMKRRWAEYDTIIKSARENTLSSEQKNILDLEWDIKTTTKEYYNQYGIRHCLEVTLKGEDFLQIPRHISTNDFCLQPTEWGLWSLENQKYEYFKLNNNTLLYLKSTNCTNHDSEMTRHLNKLGWEVITVHEQIEVSANYPEFEVKNIEFAKALCLWLNPSNRNGYNQERATQFIKILETFKVSEELEPILHATCLYWESEIQYNAVIYNKKPDKKDITFLKKFFTLLPNYTPTPKTVIAAI
jgi:hypothetical protein